MELRTAFPLPVDRFPRLRLRLRLAVEPQEPAFRKRSIVYGVASLPVFLE